MCYLLFSCSVVSDSLQAHGLQHTGLSWPSLSPRVCLNSCPLSQWCHPTISSSVAPFSSSLQYFPTSVLSNELAFCIRWPKFWSFSFSIHPSIEYSGWISFRIDWFDFLAIQGTCKSFLQHHSLKASVLQCSVFFTCIRFYFLTHFKEYTSSKSTTSFASSTLTFIWIIPIR